MKRSRELLQALAAISDMPVVMAHLKTLSDNAAWASAFKGGDTFLSGKAIGIVQVIEEINSAREEIHRG